MVESKIHECEVCGHVGEDVEWEDTPYRPGYYCQDGVVCFSRWQELRQQEETKLQAESTKGT